MNPHGSGKRRDAFYVASVTALHALFIMGAAVLVAGCERPPVESTQSGFRGTGMADIQNPRLVEDKMAANVVPAALPALPAGSGPTAGQTYQNVQVLGDLSVGEFTRLMVAMTNWVSPEQGCNYCHVPDDLASDDIYTKVVSRRMIEMTQHVNADWKDHVAETGVTCYTCHRGEPVPAEIWFKDTSAPVAKFAGNRAGQNTASMEVALAALPIDSYSAFLEQENAPIRIEGTTALPTGNRTSIKQAEWTYGLMMHFSQSLGVNCTHCHNSRHFSAWDESPPTRAQAWHGIQMVRNLNTEYLVPLKDNFPPERLGPSGDSPKLNCGTCHQGANKPLYGARMLGDYGALAGPVVASPVVAPPAVEEDVAPASGEATPPEAEEENVPVTQGVDAELPAG